MNRGSLLAVLLAVVSTAIAEPLSPALSAGEIPLDTICASSIPGTRDIVEFEAHETNEIGPILREIMNWHLSEFSADWPREGTQCRKGFAVQIAGLSALRAARDGLADKSSVPISFDAKESIWLAFFMYQMGAALEIRRVTHDGNRFEIEYRLIQTVDQEMHAYLALIPVRTLPPGQYSVIVTQQRTGQQLLDGTYADKPEGSRNYPQLGDRFVSKGFDFVVE